MQHHHWHFVAKLGAFLPPIYRIFTAFLRQGSAALNRGHAKGAWSVEHGINPDANSSLSAKVGEHAHFRARFGDLEEYSQPTTVNCGATTANLPHFYRVFTAFLPLFCGVRLHCFHFVQQLCFALAASFAISFMVTLSSVFMFPR